MQNDMAQATVESYNTYYPFGMLMPGANRNYSSANYRYGFNGKEMDNDMRGGTGATYDYGFRIYDSRIAKFLSVDPLTKDYPWYTPYQFAGNMPIWAIDLDGLEEVKYTIKSFVLTEELKNKDEFDICRFAKNAFELKMHYIEFKDFYSKVFNMTPENMNIVEQSINMDKPTKIEIWGYRYTKNKTSFEQVRIGEINSPATFELWYNNNKLIQSQHELIEMQDQVLFKQQRLMDELDQQEKTVLAGIDVELEGIGMMVWPFGMLKDAVPFITGHEPVKFLLYLDPTQTNIDTRSSKFGRGLSGLNFLISLGERKFPKSFTINEIGKLGGSLDILNTLLERIQEYKEYETKNKSSGRPPVGSSW